MSVRQLNSKPAGVVGLKGNRNGPTIKLTAEPPEVAKKNSCQLYFGT